MKSIFVLMAAVALTSLASPSAHAQRGPGHGPSYGDQNIYEALDAREIRIARVGATTLEKSVGGLRCTAVYGVGPGPGRSRPRYECELSNRRRNDQAIYNALNVRPTRIHPRIVGAVIDEKSVGGLICRSSRPVVPRAIARVECQLRQR